MVFLQYAQKPPKTKKIKIAVAIFGKFEVNTLSK